MRQKITCIGFALAALFMIRPASATVTTQGWWHFGDGGTIMTDSSGHGHDYTASYFFGPEPPIVDNAVGGPLGATGFVSTNCARFGFGGFGTETLEHRLHSAGHQLRPGNMVPAAKQRLRGRHR